MLEEYGVRNENMSKADLFKISRDVQRFTVA